MRELTCDVAIVGAGPAGLAAAAAARAQGADALVIDEHPEAGGQIWRASYARGLHEQARKWLERARGARFLHGAAVYDAAPQGPAPQGHGERAPRPAAPPAPHALSVWQRAGGAGEVAGAATVHASRVVLALGATERFLPFPGWTLPGVVGVGGLQALMKGGLALRGARAEGRRVLVAGSGPLLLAVAAALVEAGAHVVAVAEQAPRSAVLRLGLGLVAWPAKLAQGAALTARLRGVPVLHDAWVTRVEGAGRLTRAYVSHAGRARAFDVDLVACGFGLVPTTQLGELIGCARAGEGLAVDEDLATSVPRVYAAGETTGIGGVDAALAEGALAGLAAAGADARVLAPARARVARQRRFAAKLARAYALRPELRALASDDTLICRCEDVALGAVRGFTDARSAKLATRCGMGACQARVCGAALECVLGWPREAPRPPLFPVPFAALAASPSGTPREPVA
ncbi:MAG: FAD/NAD(P)-binding oxidoreductase [Planctomycetota bacterium]